MPESTIGRRRLVVIALPALVILTTAVALPQVPPAERAAGVPATAVAATIAQLHWLAGSWASEPSPLQHEEHWTSPAGGAMVGMHRTIKGDRMVEFEFLRIQEQNGSLVYLASPGGRPPTSFPLVSVDERRVVFENPSHDFPQRIIYARDGDRLTARIEGDRNGRAASMEWTWTRSTLVR